MITQKLEDLILNGQATFKTFVAGGSNKPILTIKQDSFIIITDITYFSGIYLKEDLLHDLHDILRVGFNTQVTILGNKGFNRFVFRNNFNLAEATERGTGNTRPIHVPNGHTKIDTYLIHTEAVSFTFSNGVNYNFSNNNIAQNDVPAYNAPLDCGKDGLPNSLPSIFDMSYTEFVPPLFWIYDAQNTGIVPLAPGNYITQEFSYPVTPVTNMENNDQNILQWATPLLHVNYVEIKGLPNNINTK